MTWAVLILFGLLFRQVMRFQEELATIGAQMARAEDKGLPAITYQNSITPPLLTNLWIGLVVLTLATLAFHGFYFGVASVFIAVAVFVGAFLTSGVLSNAIGKPRRATYCMLAFNTLVNREADYRRDGDIQRADAAKHFASLMILVVGDELRERAS